VAPLHPVPVEHCSDQAPVPAVGVRARDQDARGVPTKLRAGDPVPEPDVAAEQAVSVQPEEDPCPLDRVPSRVRRPASAPYEVRLLRPDHVGMRLQEPLHPRGAGSGTPHDEDHRVGRRVGQRAVDHTGDGGHQQAVAQRATASEHPAQTETSASGAFRRSSRRRSNRQHARRR
jgi:hypothetical protein